MALLDEPLETLRALVPDVAEPTDFDAYWDQTLTQSRAAGWDMRVTPVTTPITALEVLDLEFAGFAGHPVRAWLMRPRGETRDLPVVVEFNGYGGGRGLPHEWLKWPTSGYAYVIMDTRGQGGWWGSGGHTPDPVGLDVSGPGYVTRGIAARDDLYYRRVFTDAVRLLDALAGMPGTDASRICVTGTSQGGGIAIAVAGLVPTLAAAMPDVPFGCHWRHSVDHSDEDPYAEVRRYLNVHHDQVDTVFHNLGYVDAVNFARRASAPALFSAGLMDPVCLPTTVFAAHNLWAGPHEIAVYPFAGHEGGGGRHFLAQAAFLERTLQP